MKKSNFSIARKDGETEALIEQCDHRTLAVWAKACAKRVLAYFETEFPEDGRPRQALETLQEWIDTGKFSMSDLLIDNLFRCCYCAAISIWRQFMTVKRITIRVSLELHQQLVKLSGELEKSLNNVAVEVLESYAEKVGKLPLQKMSDLLAPAAESNNISEEEILELARSVRKRLWQERYEKAVQAVKS